MFPVTLLFLAKSTGSNRMSGIRWGQGPWNQSMLRMTDFRWLYLGKLKYFTNLKCWAIWGWFPYKNHDYSEVAVRLS